MGRHAVPEPSHDSPDPTASPGSDLLARAVLALAAGLATLLASSWAGLPWRQAGLAALAVAVVVVVAAWVAGTMPQRPSPGPTPYSDARDSEHRDE